MAALLGIKTPDAKPVPPPPERSSAQVAAAAAEQRGRFFGAQGGRADTEFTGGAGGGSTNAISRLLGNTGR